MFGMFVYAPRLTNARAPADPHQAPGGQRNVAGLKERSHIALLWPRSAIAMSAVLSAGISYVLVRVA